MRFPRFAFLTHLALALAGIVQAPPAAGAVSALDRMPLRSDRTPVFSGDLALSVDVEAHPALSASFSIPYSEVQWIKVERGEAAGVECTVVVNDSKGFPAGGDVWERRVVVGDYRATRAPGAVINEQRTVNVRPGRYEVVLTVRDLNSGNQSSARQRLDVPDYSRMPVGFADLMIGVWKGDTSFVPVPTRRLGVDSENLGARALLFDRREGGWPRSYKLHYAVRQENGDVVVEADTSVSLPGSGRPLLLRPRGGPLFLGAYVLELVLTEGKSRWRAERSFEVEAAGPPRGKEFSRVLEVLAYIAVPEEIEHLRGLTPEEQGRGWEEFWRRRDPTPDTPENESMIEFFRRVRHAEQSFQGAGPGWRSDMGRIYIKYGPPDQVENRAATVDSPTLEVWYYYNPYRRFFFADRDGFGRYVLLNPQAEL